MEMTAQWISAIELACYEIVYYACMLSSLVVVASYVLCAHILVYGSIISSTILSSSH